MALLHVRPQPQTQSPTMIHAFFVVVACFCLLDVLNLRKVHSFSTVAPIHEDRITPFHSPEDVVRKQLDAFQRSDIKAAFACGSTEHQDVCGPTSQEFKELLLSEPAFSTLIGHTKSTVLMTTDCADGEGKCCYVRIIPSKWKAISSSSNTHHHHQLHKRSCLEYWFELSKTTTTPTTQTTTQSQQNNEEEEDSTWTHIAANLLIEEEGHETEEGCWKIDSILPDFEDLSLVSFEADDHDDDTVEDGIYYVNNNVNHKNIDTDADADDDQQQQQQQQQDQLRQIGNDIDEISQIIIKNMIQQTVVDSNDTDDDEDDGVTEYE